MKHQFLAALRKVVRTPLSNGKHDFPADSELLIMDDSDRSRATSSRLMAKLETAMNFLETEAFFDFSAGPVRGLLAQTDHVWDALALLPAYIENVMRPEVFGEVEEGARLESERVQLGEGSRVERGAII